jgi:hypothetical protein
MKFSIDELRNHYHSQLDLISHVSRVGLGYCEKTVEANTATARRLLAIPIMKSASHGNLAELLVTGGNIAIAHWTASVSRGIDYQRQIFSSLANK